MRGFRGGVLGPNEVGRTYGELTAVRRLGREELGALYEFKCSCGGLCERVIAEVRYQAKRRAMGKRLAPVACRNCVEAFMVERHATLVRTTMKRVGRDEQVRQGV
jgi:hypothetical protein